jgi:hypothetical protein
MILIIGLIPYYKKIALPIDLRKVFESVQFNKLI